MKSEKPIPKFYGVVTAGKLELDEREKFAGYVRTMDGSKVSLVVKKCKQVRDRSLNQNAYYWGVIVTILADSLGYDIHEHDELHEALKFKFLSGEKDGRLPFVRSTATLTTADFEDYLAMIRTWASMEYGIYLPLPHETDFNYPAP